jgi:fucose 4-O-acetylase-like acetyltransferase
MATIRELAERTPSTRRRSIDFLRAVAIIAVVLGHWLIIAVSRDASGNLTGYTALQELSWLHLLTWVFQVMPIFFFVGGVSNAISWNRHRDRGGSAARWLLDRSARLFPPVTALLLVISAGALIAGWAGVPTAVTAQAVHLVTMPLWFLVVYLGVIALTPIMYRLHQRFGLLVPLVLLIAVAIGDVAHLSTGNDTWAFGNFVFAWLAVHQLGFAWQDGSLRLSGARAVAVIVGSAVALVLLTGPGPYPVSMVSVPGAAMQNAGPPTLALMALAGVQIGLVGLTTPALERWLRRRGPWSVVIAVNAVIMTLYLWHMVAALAGAVLLGALGWLPASTDNEPAFWWGRIPWILTLVLIQLVLIAIFGRIETRSLTRQLGGRTAPAEPSTSDGAGTPLAHWAVAVSRLASRLPVVAAAYAAAVLGFFLLASAGEGPHGPFMIPTSALVLVLSAAAVLRIGRADRSEQRTGRASTGPPVAPATR